MLDEHRQKLSTTLIQFVGLIIDQLGEWMHIRCSAWMSQLADIPWSFPFQIETARVPVNLPERKISLSHEMQSGRDDDAKNVRGTTFSTVK